MRPPSQHPTTLLGNSRTCAWNGQIDPQVSFSVSQRIFFLTCEAPPAPPGTRSPPLMEEPAGGRKRVEALGSSSRPASVWHFVSGTRQSVVTPALDLSGSRPATSAAAPPPAAGPAGRVSAERTRRRRHTRPRSLVRWVPAGFIPEPRVEGRPGPQGAGGGGRRRCCKSRAGDSAAERRWV